MAKIPGVGYTPVDGGTLVKWIEQREDGSLVVRKSLFRDTGRSVDVRNKTQFELRYGEGTFAYPTGRRKRWADLDNESFSIVRLALINEFQNGRLGSPQSYTGEPTELEIMDAMAVGAGTGFVQVMFREQDLQGFRKENPINVRDTSRVFGAVWQELDRYTRLNLWYRNTYKAKETTKPTEPINPPIDTPKPVEPEPGPVKPEPSTPAPTDEVQRRVAEICTAIELDAKTLLLRRNHSGVISDILDMMTVASKLETLKIFIRAAVEVKRKIMN